MDEGERGGIALWRRVGDDLRRRIREGTLAGRLPSEAELASAYGVNRHTLRRALAVLAEEGTVRTQRGLGTFVAAAPARLSYALGPRTRFSASLAGQVQAAEGRLIGAATVAADAALASRLGCRIGAPVHRLETLRVADGVPLSAATTHFPAERFPGIVEAYAETGSITEALKREGCADYRRAETRIFAEAASAKDAERLRLPPGAPVLVTLGLDVDLAGLPVQALRTRFAADRMELVVRPDGGEG